jgi:hypothetical protein
MTAPGVGVPVAAVTTISIMTAATIVAGAEATTVEPSMTVYSSDATSSPPIARGSTVFFTTTFYDITGAVTQPAGAIVALAYTDENGAQIDNAIVTMTSPTGPATAWVGQWDSRSIGPGVVACSIHTTGGVPAAVQDFQFTLSANTANLPTF